jgi:hypothetical protein
MSWQQAVLSILTKRKVAKYRRRTYSRWQNALNPVVSSNDMTYETWLVYVQKSTIYIYIHTSPLIPQVAPMHLTLHGQRCISYNNILTSWGRDHKTFLGPHAPGAWSWPVARQTRYPYHTIGTVLNQTSSWGDWSRVHITRGEDTYILTLSYVRCYRIVNCIK